MVLPPLKWLSRTFGGAQGQRGAATSWSAAPLSIFRAAPIANWQQEAGLPKTAFACNGITALGLIPFHQKCGRATPQGEAQASASPARGPFASRTGCSRSASVSQRLTKCETGVDAAYPAPYTRVCDMCGRPLRSKRNLQERCGPWSGADMCAAFDAAHTPQARMGVRGSGPIQAHALEALVAKLVFLIPSLDRCAIPLL